VKFINKIDEAWPMILKCISKKCWDKIDKVQRMHNKYQQTQNEASASLQMRLV
jgi:hypothetical protein